MTLIVAVKVPNKELNPYRRPLDFSEAGIILAADSRYSFAHNAPDDYGRKIWKLSSQALAAFSGPNVEMLEKSLTGTQLALKKHFFTKHNQVAQVVQHWLLYWQDRVPNSQIKEYKKSDTAVLLALHDISAMRFYIYLLSSKNNFSPLLRDGIVSIGSGAGKFTEFFKKELDDYTKAESAPAKLPIKFFQGADNKVLVVARPPNELIPVSLWNLHGFVLGAVDSFIEKAQLPTVGGFVACASISCEGIYAKMHAKKRVNRKWYNITSSQLKSLHEKRKLRYHIPRMRSDFSIEN